MLLELTTMNTNPERQNIMPKYITDPSIIKVNMSSMLSTYLQTYLRLLLFKILFKINKKIIHLVHIVQEYSLKIMYIYAYSV